MGRIKALIITILAGFLVNLGLSATPVMAIAPTVSISELAEYINSNSFNLSYSALTDDSGTTSAQFYFRKEGGSYAAFGPVLSGASGQIQVTSSQVSDQTKYYFKVEINSGAASDETSSIYDASDPSPVQNYWKESVAPDLNKLHWKNPSDSDFSRTFIYRGENSGFSADGSHKVGELGGAPSGEMNWENFGLDSSKTYYYVLRAIDKAGNSASLVGDALVTNFTPNVLVASSETQVESNVSVLPQEADVLAETNNIEQSPVTTKAISQNASGEVEGKAEGISSKLIIYGVALLALALGLIFRLKRKSHSRGF